MNRTSIDKSGSAYGRSLPFNSVYGICAIALLDIASMAIFFLISFSQANQLEAGPARIWKLMDVVFCVSLLYMTLSTGGYRITMLGNPFSQISHILVNGSVIIAMECAVLWGIGLTNKFEWPLIGPINIVSIGAIMMCVTRLLVYRLLIFSANRGIIARRVVVVGAGSLGHRLIDVLNQRKEPWTEIVGMYDDRITRLPDMAADVKRSGTVADLIDYARDHRVDEILVALPWHAEQRLSVILERLKVIPASVRLAPDGIGLHFLDANFGRVDGLPVYNIYGKPISGGGRLLKRSEDLVLGSIILAIACPIMALCAIAIAIESRGPILSRHTRYGYNNQAINIYKFRTSRQRPRDNRANLPSLTQRQISRVGIFLRRFSLDELPQIFNVLRGDMSLVGPRPHATQAKATDTPYQEAVDKYVVRHQVKPGLTGWAQVMGWRGDADTEEKIRRRIECDLYYMENWSVFLDIEILFRTLSAVSGERVYSSGGTGSPSRKP